MSARRCHRCGRETDDPIVTDRDDDRGPTGIVWCRDQVLCEQARKGQRSRIPRRAHL